MVYTIYIALGYLARFLEFMVLVRCILSWLPLNFNNPIVGFIMSVTEPLMAPIRKLLYKSPLGGPGMMLDISPIIVLFIIQGVYSMLGMILLG